MEFLHPEAGAGQAHSGERVPQRLIDVPRVELDRLFLERLAVEACGDPLVQPDKQFRAEHRRRPAAPVDL